MKINRSIKLIAVVMLVAAVALVIQDAVVRGSEAAKEDMSFHTPPMSDLRQPLSNLPVSTPTPVDNSFRTPPMSDLRLPLNH